VLAGGAGLAMMLPEVVNAVAVTESEVSIKTPDGTADCYFVHPSTGTGAGVLYWPDIFGLRPAARQMGKRLAESGYSVLVVNPFYRTKKAPDVAPQGGQTPIPTLLPLAQSLNEMTHMTDAKAFIAWLDEQASVAKNRKIGTQGYCMGGPMAFRTAAAVPDRVGAVASFHGGGLVTKDANSPHLQASKSKAQFLIEIADNDDKRAPDDKTVLKDTFAKTKAQYLFAIAENDDMRQPESKDILKKTLADAKLTGQVEVYKAAHGWCPPDTTVYDKGEAERAWSNMLAMFKKSLA